MVKWIVHSSIIVFFLHFYNAFYELWLKCWKRNLASEINTYSNSEKISLEVN